METRTNKLYLQEKAQQIQFQIQQNDNHYIGIVQIRHEQYLKYKYLKWVFHILFVFCISYLNTCYVMYWTVVFKY